MSRRTWLFVGALIFVLLVSSCRREDNSIPPIEEQDRIIATASLTDTPNELLLTWFPVECETFQGVEVEPTDEFINIRIRVVVDVVTCPPGGFSQTTVDVGEPLDDRLIWDRAFGDTVALTDPPAPDQ